MDAKKTTGNRLRNVKSEEKWTLPALWRTDARPDPSTMSAADRATEFGRILFRAIERRRARTGEKYTPDESMEQQ